MRVGATRRTSENTRCIASDYAKQGLRANVIAPGVIDTPLTRNYASGMPGGEAEGLKILAAMHPIGRYAVPKEISEADFTAALRFGQELARMHREHRRLLAAEGIEQVGGWNAIVRDADLRRDTVVGGKARRVPVCGYLRR